MNIVNDCLRHAYSVPGTLPCKLVESGTFSHVSDFRVRENYRWGSTVHGHAWNQNSKKYQKTYPLLDMTSFYADTPENEVILNMSSFHADIPGNEVILNMSSFHADTPGNEVILNMSSFHADTPENEVILNMSSFHADTPGNEVILNMSSFHADTPGNEVILNMSSFHADTPGNEVILHTVCQGGLETRAIYNSTSLLSRQQHLLYFRGTGWG